MLKLIPKLKKLTWVLTWVAIGWIMYQTFRSLPLSRGSSPPPSAPTIEQIQQLSSLVTLRVEVADVLESSITGYTGGVKAVLVVKGDLLLGVDLSQAKLEKVDLVARTAVLVLPRLARYWSGRKAAV